jgi:pilus assembly protein CpaF
MGLSQKFKTLEALGLAPVGRANAMPANIVKTPAFLTALRARLHEQLVTRLDLSTIEKLPPAQVTRQLQEIIGEIMSEIRDLPLDRDERQTMTAELIDEVTGLGPLEPFLRDPSISDILVNTASNVYIERGGRLERAATSFRDNDHLQQIINRIVSRVGRRVDDSSPMVDARLPDGSRVNAVIPPLALDGPLLSIRRFGGKPLRFADLVSGASVTPHMVGLLGACVRAKVSILISGGTGTGKTTLLNALSAFIPEGERVVTIEDAAELQLQQEHVARMETRPANVEGKGEIIARDLVRNALRMRPDRIIVGEVRGSEVMDMLQAMNTGHAGSMTTIHANSPRDAITRIESMAAMSGSNLPEMLIKQTIARSLEVIVQLSRGTDGKRRISSISEITGMEGNVITQNEIFWFKQTGIAEDGRITGEFQATGVRPKILEKIARSGIDPMTIAREFGAA